MVAAKIDAKIIPTPICGIVSIAIIGNPNSGSKSLAVNRILLARPIININIMKGVCHTKNQIIACLRSESDPRVITLETTWGCPATPRPPRKNAKAHIENPNLKSGGKNLVSMGSCASRPSVSPPNPPTSCNAIQQRIVDPTIITQDWAASVQIEALIPPA